LAVLIVCSSFTEAANLAPDDRQIVAAIDHGRALALAHDGYSSRYIAWAVPDARNIDPTLGAVDAVLVATPLERATHAGFVAAYNGRQLTVRQFRGSAEFEPEGLRIILFTHGPDARDESYVDRFTDARLVFGDRTLVPIKTEHSGPTDSIYPLAADNRQRQISTISYHFDLSSSAALQVARARLQFTDDTGKRFDLPIDLDAYP
jgi:hypothetical protein